MFSTLKSSPVKPNEGKGIRVIVSKSACVIVSFTESLSSSPAIASAIASTGKASIIGAGKGTVSACAFIVGANNMQQKAINASPIIFFIQFNPFNIATLSIHKRVAYWIYFLNTTWSKFIPAVSSASKSNTTWLLPACKVTGTSIVLQVSQSAVFGKVICCFLPLIYTVLVASSTPAL
ncbi:hypothetical protein LMOh7858_2596 [Listeria monocytogenes str. 4b H7858]|nr:hypothetical protein LMOh7858_2596 [Listeria monocytogenes str. 4b H7858] [Listeria monocytogenes serotype 4b str. H7858]